MREEIEAYLKSAKSRPFSIEEMAIDLWYPLRMRTPKPARFIEEATPIIMQMVGDGLVVQTETKDHEQVFYWKAYADADKASAKARLARGSKHPLGWMDTPQKAKNAPFIIH